MVEERLSLNNIAFIPEGSRKNEKNEKEEKQRKWVAK